VAGDAADGRRVETRGVVDENVERTEAVHRDLDEVRQPVGVEQVGASGHRRPGAPGVEFAGERGGIGGGAAVMQHDVCALFVQAQRDRPADALWRTGHQCCLARELQTVTPQCCFENCGFYRIRG
jgi:hypothetical protein